MACSVLCVLYLTRVQSFPNSAGGRLQRDSGPNSSEEAATAAATAALKQQKRASGSFHVRSQTHAAGLKWKKVTAHLYTKLLALQL
jgi:hypothetical protein